MRDLCIKSEIELMKNLIPWHQLINYLSSVQPSKPINSLKGIQLTH